MATVNLDDAKVRLPEIISGLNPGEQLLAALTRSRPNQWPCKAGSARDTKHWMASDFDAPLEAFREYME